MQYSFGFQRELPGNFIFEASYVGRQARQLFTLAMQLRSWISKIRVWPDYARRLNHCRIRSMRDGAITPIPGSKIK
jgi:hypothetical protein